MLVYSCPSPHTFLVGSGGGTRMKLIRIITIIMVLLYPSTILAEINDEWKKLDKISNEALQLAKNERFEEAKQILTQFSEEFLKLNAREKLKSMDELQVITLTHESAMKTLTTTALPAEERVDSVTKFRLVIDAVHSNYQPMWSEMEEVIMETFYRMREAVEVEDEKTFRVSLEQFLDKYDTIEPSVKIDVSPERYKRVDADIELLENLKFSQLSQEAKLKQLDQMEFNLKSLFADVKGDEADSSLWWVMITTGSIIVLTLSYVGWRKYQGEKKEYRSREKE